MILRCGLLVSILMTGISAAQSQMPTQKSYIDELIDTAQVIMDAAGEDRDMDLVVALLREAMRANNTWSMQKLAAVLIEGDKVSADPAGREAPVVSVDKQSNEG